MGFDINKAAGGINSLSRVKESVKNVGSGTLSGNDIIDVEIENIQTNDMNFYSQKQIEELAVSISEMGLLEPLTVKYLGNKKFLLISGHRRLAALKILKWKTARCIVKTDLDEIDTEIMLIEYNGYREKDPIEKAREISRLFELFALKYKDDKSVSKEDIIDLVKSNQGLSRAQVYRYFKMDKLVPGLAQLVAQERLSATAASEFGHLDEKSQNEIFEVIKENPEEINTAVAEKIKKTMKSKKNSGITKEEIFKAKEETKKQVGMNDSMTLNKSLTAKEKKGQGTGKRGDRENTKEAYLIDQTACMGYVISALKELEFRDKEVVEVIHVLKSKFRELSSEEAAITYKKNIL